MAQQLSDEEQLQVLKNWWNKNGSFLIAGLALAVSAFFGWQWWQSYREGYALEASAIYIELIETVSSFETETEQINESDYATAKYLVEQLQNDYHRSMYAVNASLLVAKLAVDRSDLETAEAELLKALEFSDDDTNPLVRLRLAKVLFAQQKYDQALTYVSDEPEDATTEQAMDYLFIALRGDIQAARGNNQAARAAYQQAIEAMQMDNSQQRRLLEIKLSNLAVEDDS
ncbi:MAG: putative negative regulator of RcsB-dependent stress response [Cellvibrionaceae bacterium]